MGAVQAAGAKQRSNFERAAKTQRQVMDAVIAIMNERGFSALTNTLILAHTGLSTGALMHHFPSRISLLSAMVGYAHDGLTRYRREQLQYLEPGLPRFRALIDLSWHTARMPAGFAINEVRIGARSDDALASKLAPAFTSTADDYARLVSGIAREAGLKPDGDVQGLWTATSMTMRSLAIDMKTYASAELASNTLTALRTLREQLIRKQLGEASVQDPRIAWTPVQAHN